MNTTSTPALTQAPLTSLLRRALFVLLVLALSVLSMRCGNDAAEADISCTRDAECASKCAERVCGGDNVTYATCNDDGKRAPYCYCLCNADS